MTETQKRIEAYKKALPEIRERVIAVALLFAMSMAMMTSATFAWLTISRAPEVTAVNTTVAANGNLEIALAKEDFSVPEESKVGDSSANEDRSVAGANITWGNLVNLSDPIYGLDNLVLRPAQLNESSLITTPLFGAVYSEDGRVETLSSSFGFGKWDPEAERFMIENTPGVRAISSVTVEAVGFAQQVYDKRTAADTANLMAGSAYLAITQNGDYMNSLATVMGTFMTAKMNAGQGDESLTNPTIDSKDVQNLTAIFEAFVEVYDLQLEAMVKLVNYQLFLQNNSEAGNTPYTEYTAETLKAVDEKTLKNRKLQATGLNQWKTDYPKLEDGFEKLQVLCEQGTVKWDDSGIDDIVNSLMNVGTCTLDDTPINNIGVSNATGYLDGKTHEAKLTNGVLWNFEKMNGARCKVEKLTVSAKVKRLGITIPASIAVNITTNAPTPSLFSSDLEYADGLNQGSKGTEVAQDTYGMAVDLWVRTNAEGSYLTLEGNVLTESEQVRAMGKDSAGNNVELYTLTRTDEVEGETATYTIELYKKETTEGEGENATTTTTWYDATGHSSVTLNEGETPLPKMDTVTTVIGFEGENRIWDESKGLSTDATTQGSGSCYVYYADTPEDQARSLELLKAFEVAFVNSQGQLVATASMDTERFFAENGRVIVPLVLDSTSSIDLGEDFEGNTTYAIMQLEKNTPTWLTAIVYLDGTELSNDKVLAASDIQGQLNIQFGTSAPMQPIDNETLENKILSVTASLDKNEFDWDTDSNFTTNVTLNIEGDAPNTITAFFLRQISSTQGSRETEMTFTKNAEGKWVSSYTFTAPGNYILRTVTMDGQEYVLKETPEVTVEGFAIESISSSKADANRHISVMTASSTFDVDLSVKFATNDQSKMPTTVQARFLNDDDGSAVNVNLTYNSTTQLWSGSATFISSGNYTMEYLVFDGEYAPQVPEQQRLTAAIFLGMKVAVYTQSPTSFKYVPSELADNQANLYMQVEVMDNTGEPIEGLTGLNLYYFMQGSSLAEKGMSTPLNWNAASKYYEGTFESKVGVYYFNNVTVGSSNNITNATTSPTFRIISPEPPSYTGYIDYPHLFSQTPNINMAVKTKNASTATVVAVIKNLGDGKTYEVQGQRPKDDTSTTEETWNFLIPVTNGKQDGNWQITEVKFWNYYDEAGNFIEAEIDDDGILVKDGKRDAPLTRNVEAYNIVTKAVNTINYSIVLPEGFDKDLGKDDNGTITAAFMDTQTVNGLSVVLTDFEDERVGYMSGDTFVSVVSDVKFVYDYDGDTQNKGRYSSTAVAAKTAAHTVDLAKGNDHKTFTQSNGLSVQYAGTYTPKLQYTVSGGTTVTVAAENMKDKAPTFTVWSKKPTVTISSVSTNASTDRYYLTPTPSSLNVISGSYNNKIDNYNAVVYMYVSERSGSLDQEQVQIKYPTVTLSLSGIPTTHSGVTMVFPSGNNTSSTFTFAAGGTTARSTIGAGTSGEFNEGFYGIGAKVESWPVFYPAGKQTVDEITVNYNNMTFTVKLSDAVTINNPLYPPYVDFAINEASYPGSVPARVYSTDGETVTLPSANAVTATWNESRYNSVKANVDATTTTTDYYETWTQYRRDYYQKYTKTVIVETADETYTSYIRTWNITGWRIGNNNYAFGTTIPVTGSQTANAVLSYVDSGHTTTEYALVTTTKYFDRGDDTQGTPPANYVNVTSDPDNGNKDNWTSSKPNVTYDREEKN